MHTRAAWHARAFARTLRTKKGEHDYPGERGRSERRLRSCLRLGGAAARAALRELWLRRRGPRAAAVLPDVRRPRVGVRRLAAVQRPAAAADRLSQLDALDHDRLERLFLRVRRDRRD